MKVLELDFLKPDAFPGL